MLRFKVLSKVHSFHFKGKRYFPDEIVECSEEDAALFNLDFLERLPESAPNAEVSIVEVTSAVAKVDLEVKADVNRESSPKELSGLISTEYSLYLTTLTSGCIIEKEYEMIAELRWLTKLERS